MKTRASVRREAPLEVCPLPGCRRSGTCRHNTPADPCRRLFETQAHFYTQLARKIARLQREAIARRPRGVTVAFAPEGTPKFEERLKQLYEGLRATEQANSSAAGKAARRRKPASAPGGA